MSGNGESDKARRSRMAREGQRLPLFMSAARSRLSERVAISVAMSAEMEKYLKWACEAAT
jgi:hypothetical protein